jgi:hypothetical protein
MLDIAFAEIAVDLNVDQFERYRAGIGKKAMDASDLCVHPVSATPLVVYRLAFGSPRSFADVD